MPQGADGDHYEPHRSATDAGYGLIDPAEDEFAVEISPLGQPPFDTSGAAADELTAQRPSAVASPFDARLTPRRRAIAAASAVGAVALALAVVLGTLPGAGPALGTALGFATPTPTATLTVGADTVYLANSVPWGKLTVDGHTQILIVPGLGGIPHVTLARGTHTLVYTAAPFPTVRCTTSVPATSGDTCRASSYPTLGVTFPAGTFRIVDVRATPDHLPDDQYVALTRAIMAALAVPDGTVQPGDHYLADSGETMVASTPLTAHLIITLPGRGTVNDSVNGVTCDPLCPDLNDYQPSSDQSQLGAMVTFEWQIASANGQLVATTPTPDEVAMFIGLQVKWSGTWSVTTEYPQEVQQNVCAIAASQLWQAFFGEIVTGGGGFVQQNGPSVDPADGCLVQISTTPPLGNGSTSVIAPYTVLCRFGALVAADAATQHTMPKLPLPSANESAIIARLSGSSGG